MVISKSEYMMFLKHPAWLWLKKYDKKKLPEPDEDLQALFDQGALFEEYAEKLWPDAVRLGYKTKEGEFSGTKYYALPQDTATEIGQGTQTILQGRLETELVGLGTVTAIFDVLERREDGTHDLIEIKSSTSVKPEHKEDLAFQTTVLESAGLKISDIHVVFVNNEYVRDGDIVPEEITKRENVTSEVRSLMPETLGKIEEAFNILKDSKNMPDVSPRYLNNCPVGEWLPILEAIEGKHPEYSIYDMCLLKADTVARLEDAGVKELSEIPEDFALSERQERQVRAVKSGEREVHAEEIREFLESFAFPMHFFDYETVAGAIPLFDGTRPYQQVPFQYSLHIWESPDAELVHKEYLHTDNSLPMPALLEKMRGDFEPQGSVVSWNKRFEIGRNNEMAKMYPEYESFLLDINERMVDLMDPFSKGWFVDKDFRGSASLKAVLPVLVPELSYKALEVQHGGQAQRVWMQTVLGGKNAESKNEIMEHLRKYCTLDTYSMYALLQYLLREVEVSY